MVVHRERKVRRYRGHTTHGGGHRKKRRGGGSRGGRGNAGTGKKSGHKKDKYHTPIGKHGFHTQKTRPAPAVNVGYFTSVRLKKLLAEGKITQEQGFFVVDLEKLGFSKLLGTGSLHDKIKLTTGSSSPQAQEKVKAAGGQLSSAD